MRRPKVDWTAHWGRPQEQANLLRLIDFAVASVGPVDLLDPDLGVDPGPDPVDLIDPVDLDSGPGLEQDLDPELAPSPEVDLEIDLDLGLDLDLAGPDLDLGLDLALGLHPCPRLCQRLCF